MNITTSARALIRSTRKRCLPISGRSHRQAICLVQINGLLGWLTQPVLYNLCHGSKVSCDAETGRISSGNDAEKTVVSDAPLAEDGPEKSKSSTVEEINHGERSETHIQGWRFAIMIICVAAAAFVIGYDNNCVATILPVLTNEFHALGDMGWYSTSYLITSTAAVLNLGKLYTLFDFKPVFISVMGIFLIGSIVCASAQSSIAFICGRAVTGLGNAGILSGINIVVSRITPLRTRPFWQGFVGMVECLAICAGPLIGGAITAYSTWRACFYVTIPISASTIVVILFLFSDVEKPTHVDLPIGQKCHQMDLPGAACFFPGITCLVLALEWGGISYSWRSYRVLIPLVLFFVLIAAFIAHQFRRGSAATIPLGLFRSRTVVASAFYGGFNSATLFILAYYLPLWFQTVWEKTPFMSGVWTLPMVIGLTISIITAGSITTYIGYYTPTLLLGSVLIAISTGLMLTVTRTTSTGRWIVFQALYGLGCGLGWQTPYIAVQTVVQKDEITPALVMLGFAFSLGGIFALAVAQNVYAQSLSRSLRSVLPDLSVSGLVNTGATELIQQAGAGNREAVLKAYNDAFVRVAYSAVAVACVSLVCALAIKVKSVKKDGSKDRESQEKESQEKGQAT